MNNETKVNKEIEPQIKDEIEACIKEKFWDIYASNTGDLSNICRQLAFAEGGICWFYIQDSSFTIEIKIILTFLLGFFIADASQYYFLATNNKKQAKFYENLLNINLITSKEQIQRPIEINTSGNICFQLKLVSIAIASILLVAKFYYL